MKKQRRMNTEMQAFSIGRMLAGTKINSELFDIRAHLDSTLSYGENKRNIQKMSGTTTRNYGREQYEQREHERARERKRRQNPLRQSSMVINEMLDRARLALPPGKRISRTGHRYYEYRANRSDIPPTRL